MALRHFTVWAILVSSLGSTAFAGPRDQAYKLFNRVNGTPPSAAKLEELTGLIESGDVEGAALAAINDSNAMFYNVMLKNIVSRWTNTDKTPRVLLNDYTATVIGMIRDDVPFNQVLSGDIVYTGNTAGLPAYSMANNAHYEALDNAGADLKSVLVQGQQSALTNIPAEAVAGVMTTRGFADAYYKAGTNRRAVAFTLDTFLCREMEQLADTTRSDFRVRRDIPRAPGGDSALYRNRCAGCHTGMDAIGGAFAYYDWDDTTASMIYTPGTVRTKVNRNAHEFPDGFETVDDSWINNWMEGQNAKLGWNGATTGNGAKELGEMLADSDAFSSCMAKRAVQAMCLRTPVGKDLDVVEDIAAEFTKDNYNLKNAFAKAAAYCAE